MLRRFMFPSSIPAAIGRRFVFISDLHYHATADEERRMRALAAALAGCRADAIFLGGDAVGDACHLRGLPSILRLLAGCAPKAFAVPGNWERGKRWLDIDVWRGLYGEGGFELLCNESRDFGPFFVYGSDDLIHGYPEPPPRCGAAGRFRILLTHRPDAVIAFDSGERLSDWQLALCGHTHGGQWRLPWAGACFVPGFYHRRFDRGWFGRRNGSLRMFVSSGAGELSLPGRLFCPREALLVEVVSGAKV